MTPSHAHKKPSETGFTLLEMTIALVIVGLIIGGVLVGQDMISAAQTRATIAQIEKFNTVVNTFTTKYGYLPGDIPNPYASRFGFVSRAGTSGRGDGDNFIEGWAYGGGSMYGWQQDGETLLFWVDLATAGLIDGGFTLATDANVGVISATGLGSIFPAARVGNGNYIYVYTTGTSFVSNDGHNYFGLSVPSSNSNGNLTSAPGVTVSQAYNIDKKIDDGLPRTGTVQAKYVTGASPPVLSPNASTDGPGTCYNNSTNTYSTNISNGSNPNCALSFIMQGEGR